MTYLRISRLVLFTAVIICLPVKSKAGVPDNQLWPSVLLEKGLKTGARIEFEQQLRIRDQKPHFDQTFSEFRFSYPISGDLGATLYYRQIFYQDNTAYRIAASAQAKSLPRVKWLSARLMVQRQQNRNSKPVYYARFRGVLNLQHPQSTLLLFLQGEPWLLLSDQQSWKRYRLSAGMKYQISHRLSASVFYQYQGDKREDDWSGINIIGLSLKVVQ